MPESESVEKNSFVFKNILNSSQLTDGELNQINCLMLKIWHHRNGFAPNLMVLWICHHRSGFGSHRSGFGTIVVDSVAIVVDLGAS